MHSIDEDKQFDRKTLRYINWSCAFVCVCVCVCVLFQLESRFQSHTFFHSILNEFYLNEIEFTSFILEEIYENELTPRDVKFIIIRRESIERMKKELSNELTMKNSKL